MSVSDKKSGSLGTADHYFEDCGCAARRSVLLDHNLGSFNNRNDGITFFEFQLVGATSGDGAFDEIVPHSDDDVSHHIAQLDFFDCSTEFVSG